jgi:uncharacterized membrane protein YqjE
MTNNHDHAEPRSVGEIVRELSQHLGELVRAEVQLARTEINDRFGHVRQDAAMLVAGAVLLHLALVAVCAAAVLALAQTGLESWLAALIVAVALALVGGALVAARLAAMKRRVAARSATVESLKETAQWLKHAVR